MRIKQFIKETNKYYENLSKENKEKFNKILMKIRFSNINNHDAEEFIHHCLDLFLQAEKEQVSIEKFLNTSDIDTFIGDFIEESKSGYSFLQRIYYNINYLPMTIFIFTGIWEMFVGYLIKAWVNKQTIFTVPVTLSLIVNTLIAIAMVYLFLNKAYFLFNVFNQEDKRKDRIATVCLWLGFCALTGLFVLSKLYLTQVIFYVNYIIFMVTLGFIWLIQEIIENRKV